MSAVIDFLLLASIVVCASREACQLWLFQKLFGDEGVSCSLPLSTLLLLI